jgi:molybdopterin synthase sulfur carrier subunit
MKVKVLLFGSLAEKAGKSTIYIENVKNIDGLVRKLIVDHPFLKNSKFAIALNQVIVKGNSVLNNDDEIALLPPYAGG